MAATTAAPTMPAATAELTHRQVLVVLSGLMAGMFVSALDQTIVSTALPTIVGDFKALDDISWVASIYLLTSTATMPIAGKLSDLYGRRRLFQIGIAIFLAGSVLSGISQSLVQLVLSRAIQGIGGGTILVIAFATIADVVAPRQRARYQGYFVATFAVANILGPLLGGFFVDHLSWRWIFFINVPVGIGALVVISAVLKLPARPRTDAPIDYSGAALLVGGVTSLLLLAEWGGSQFDWGSPTIVALGIGGLTLLVLFVFRERRAPDPILPLTLWRSPVFSISTTVSFLIGAGLFGAILYLPVYLQVVKGVNPTNSGLLLVPIMLGMLIGSLTTGTLITRTGRYKIYPLFGLPVMAVSFLLLSRVGADTPTIVVMAFMVLVGLGNGFGNPVLTITVQNSVPRALMGAATSVVMFTRTLGSAFGAAVLGTILANRFASELPKHVSASVLHSIDPGKLRGSPKQIHQLAPEVANGVVKSFEASLHTVFLACVPVLVVALVVFVFLEEVPLRGHDEPVGVVADVL